MSGRQRLVQIDVHKSRETYWLAKEMSVFQERLFILALLVVRNFKLQSWNGF